MSQFCMSEILTCVWCDWGFSSTSPKSNLSADLNSLPHSRGRINSPDHVDPGRIKFLPVNRMSEVLRCLYLKAFKSLHFKSFSCSLCPGSCLVLFRGSSCDYKCGLHFLVLALHLTMESGEFSSSLSPLSSWWLSYEAITPVRHM